MIRTAAASLAFAVILLGTAGCRSQDGNATPQPTRGSTSPPATNINVGVSSDMPGLGMSAGYNRSGFDVDLYQWLGLHSEPPFSPVAVPIPVSDRESALIDKRVTLVVEAFSITDDRRRKVGFAGPYLITKQGFMVRAGETRIQNSAQLNGKTVCTLSASTSKKQLTESGLKERITVTEETGIQGCVDRLKSGFVDAVSTDELILHGLAKTDPTKLTVLPNMSFGADERYGIGIPKGDLALCKALTAKIKEFIINGYWDRFFQANFGNLQNPVNYKPDVDRLDRCE